MSDKLDLVTEDLKELLKKHGMNRGVVMMAAEDGAAAVVAHACTDLELLLMATGLLQVAAQQVCGDEVSDDSMELSGGALQVVDEVLNAVMSNVARARKGASKERGKRKKERAKKGESK